MHCNNCWYENTRVSDSRTSDNGRMIRRRRYCEKCGNRFTTYEKLDVFNIVVEKSGNRRERYDREKLEDSIIKVYFIYFLNLNSTYYLILSKIYFV